jgi:hypothetical protein
MANYIPSNVKNSILAFVKNLVNKKLYNAIKVLLNPCCDIAITDVAYDCGTEELTLTISPVRPSFSSLSGFSQVFTDGGTPGDSVFVGTGTISADGKSVVVEVAVADAPVGADQIFSITFFLPTPQDNSTIGVYQIAVSGEETIPAC